MSDLLFGESALPEISAPGTDIAYRVLARKYRPQSFAQLVGQDVLVRTLTHAFKAGRIAHAFMLTGVRGVGKTTTARIIARGLNCTGPDGTNEAPTIEPCGVCQNCVAIAADRHVDVIEMDAASHNSVDDIRELTDGARYSPALGRYKVYIIDEVHMLSKAAFNALLKTLEEPPAHVKFILATTEIRKVPVTILSRCQRFDLRRVDATALTQLFSGILAQENSGADTEALNLLSRAADGSARDGLSLLDQAIARAEDGKITGEQVRGMLGLADRVIVFDLLEEILKGAAKPALDILADLHAAGADPVTILQDLLELVHHLTRAKLIPANAEDMGMPEAERVRGAALAAALTMPVVSRAWSVLLKGLGEVQSAPNARQALEMVVLRLIYTADLPTPGDLVKQLQSGGAMATPSTPPGGGGVTRSAPMQTSSGSVQAVAAQPEADSEAAHPMPVSFRAVIELFAAEREAIVAGQLTNVVHLVRFEPGMIEFRAAPSAPANLASIVGKRLSEWTGRRWMVSLATEGGAPTIAQQDAASRDQSLASAAELPPVKALLAAFPGAKLIELRSAAAKAPVQGVDFDVLSADETELWLEE